MSFPHYPAYKPSGVEWLGEVPEHWELVPCRGFVDERSEKNEDAACQNYLSLMANVGIIPYEEKGDVGNKKPEDISKCKIVRRGDFVINSMNYGIGSYGVSDYDGVCSQVYIILTPRGEVVEPRCAFRIFEDKSFQAHAQSFGNGILAHRCAIGWDDLKSITIGIPPMIEQASILTFLDRETAKIDALIAEQQRLIELLQEKRQAVISHAVTKGLNPDAPMKDSGVEWLGEVPEHWELLQLKRLSRTGSSITYGIVQAGSHIEDGVPYIRTSDMA
ncbi:MAG: restriction endonuclease subunit S, partial [Cyanobium sp.]